MAEQQEGFSTHAMAIRAADGAVTRKMQLARFPNGSFGVRMTTDWGDGSEPVVTQFGLSPVGLTMLSALLAEAHRLHEFPALPADDAGAVGPGCDA